MTEIAEAPPLLENKGAILPDGKVACGIYTLIGPKGHKTVKVKTVQDGELSGKRIVYVFKGGDNENFFNYVGVAFLNTVEVEEEEKYLEEVKDEFDFVTTVEKTRTVKKEKDTLQVWKRQRGTDFHKIAQAFLRIVYDGIDGYRYELAKHCRVCNHTLTNPESIEAGIGPECSKNVESGGTD